jgi:hypothetical protein
VIVPDAVVASTEIALETETHEVPVGEITKLAKTGGSTSVTVAAQPLDKVLPSDVNLKVKVPSEADDIIVPGLVVPAYVPTVGEVVFGPL